MALNDIEIWFIGVVFLAGFIVGGTLINSSNKSVFVKTECARYHPDTGDFEIIRRKK